MNTTMTTLFPVTLSAGEGSRPMESSFGFA